MNNSMYYYTASVRWLLPFSALQTGSSAGRWKKNISVERSRRIEQPFSRAGHKVYQSNIYVLKTVLYLLSTILCSILIPIITSLNLS